ncbi:CGI-121-domain-containing protein [Macrolepiota fuliginosa MF-IS2]|uniref:EKC/KEOPS complex subunit CGI121 n=1 Tax=Macrolepiota fuliginosa MF-IS2 TaxID=1400762 RepID=A0A9P6C9G1_9AGAR|nr:CGI-121-domain-containing protein [Macrolepiota fuliginosa MF-IS2]
MDLFYFPHLAPERATTHVALFRNVTNAAALRKRIIGASTMSGEAGELEREEINYAFIEARLITSWLHLQTAVYQAILAETQNALRTKTVHSEVLWNLNPTNNITEAIRRYGISDTTTSLLVVRIDAGTIPANDMELKMKKVVNGEIVPFSQIKDITDWSTIKKYHKLVDELAIKNARGDAVKECVAVDNIVTSTVAMKSVMA